MKLVSDRPGSLGAEQPVVICPVRNEMALLPAFLAHHRAIGVEQFIFIDNGSSDGTAGYLRAQSDCVVYWTDASFRAANFGMDWINRIIRDLNYQGWLLYADVDEHLVYCGMDSLKLGDYCRKLERAGYDTVFCAMIDMYPEGAFLTLTIDPKRSLISQMPWFDTDYVFRAWPKRPWDRYRNFALQVLGGPRCRLLSNLERERRRGAMYYTLANQVDRFVDAVPISWLPALAKIWPKEPPAQQKKPLNLVGPGFAYGNSHSASNSRLANETVAFLHFKFCHELQQRVKMVLEEANHYRRGLNYLQIQNALRKWGDRSLIYEGSRRFESADDFERAGIIGTRAAALWGARPPHEVRAMSDR
jgi:hypothetical protein